MLCRDFGQTLMGRRRLRRARKSILGAATALGLAGCGGNSHVGNFDTPNDTGFSSLAHQLGFKSNDTPAAPGTQVRHIYCPEVLILEGTAASQDYAGTPPSSANLRHQYSLTDTARECTLDGDKLAIKIGVAGRVLLGPAGSPGSFNVPVRMAVLSAHNNEPITSKLYHAPVTVPAGETQADFTIVSEPLHVPFIQDHAEDDYSIKVGIDEGTGADKDKDKPANKGAKR